MRTIEQHIEAAMEAVPKGLAQWRDLKAIGADQLWKEEWLLLHTALPKSTARLISWMSATSPFRDSRKKVEVNIRCIHRLLHGQAIEAGGEAWFDYWASQCRTGSIRELVKTYMK